MPTPLPEAGYEDLRQHIDPTRSDPDPWDYLALLDDNGDEITRVQITADDRTSWTHEDGNQTLRVEGAFSGDDDDIDVGVTIAATALFNESGVGNGLARSQDSFSGQTVEDNATNIDVIHEIEIPQV